MVHLTVFLGMQDEWEEIAMYCIRTITKVEEEQQ